MPNLALAALAAEAHRRGITYGQLVAEASAVELEEIIRKFKRKKKK